MIYFTTWGCFRQSTPSLAVDRSELGGDVSLLLVGHLALDDVRERGPFRTRSLELELDA